MRSDKIREDLDIFASKDNIVPCRESWAEHVERMPEEKIIRNSFKELTDTWFVKNFHAFTEL
jgi:hypothetical protein